MERPLERRLCGCVDLLSYHLVACLTEGALEELNTDDSEEKRQGRQGRKGREGREGRKGREDREGRSREGGSARVAATSVGLRITAWGQHMKSFEKEHHEIWHDML